MISKRTPKDLFSLIAVISLMIYYNGLNYTVDLFYQLLKLFNSVTIQLNNTSILTVMFKFCIAYPIIGVILTAIGSPRGKEGHYIGKTLYFIVGYVVGFILDSLATMIF